MIGGDEQEGANNKLSALTKVEQIGGEEEQDCVIELE